MSLPTLRNQIGSRATHLCRTIDFRLQTWSGSNLYPTTLERTLAREHIVLICKQVMVAIVSSTHALINLQGIVSFSLTRLFTYRFLGMGRRHTCLAHDGHFLLDSITVSR